MKRIFVAGPYTHGNMRGNVFAAMEAGSELIALGYAPFIPHLYHYLNLLQDYEVYMAVDRAWLEQADAVLRIPGYSPGADREVGFAGTLGIPVFHTIHDLCRHFAGGDTE